MSRPRLLDLFCGAGGSAVGYHRAGFDVVGVDIKPQPNYPFRVHQMDALVYVRELLNWSYPLCDFDAIHASPPCQAYTTMSNRWRGAGGLADRRQNLIPATRELLERTGLPYVIENVADQFRVRRRDRLGELTPADRITGRCTRRNEKRKRRLELQHVRARAAA